MLPSEAFHLAFYTPPTGDIGILSQSDLTFFWLSTLKKQPLFPESPQLTLTSCSSRFPQVSIILTLMVPYDAIDTESPLMEMFVVHGFYAAKFIVAIGSVAGLTVSLLGSLFPMPRVIYAMAGDGLLFRSVVPMLAFIFSPLGPRGEVCWEGRGLSCTPTAHCHHCREQQACTDSALAKQGAHQSKILGEKKKSGDIYAKVSHLVLVPRDSAYGRMST